MELLLVENQIVELQAEGNKLQQTEYERLYRREVMRNIMIEIKLR